MLSQGLQIEIVQVPEDNSCLFHCVHATCFASSASEDVSSLRKLCATLYASTPEFRDFPKLEGEDLHSMIANVQKPGHWGGNDELVVFSKFKEVEFVIISENSKSVVNRIWFPHSAKYKKRIYLYWCSTSASSSSSFSHSKESIKPKNMAHYNYFAEVKTRKSVFQETETDQMVLEAIAKCIGKPVPVSSPAKLPEKEKEKEKHQEMLIRCQHCGSVTLYKIPSFLPEVAQVQKNFEKLSVHSK